MNSCIKRRFFAIFFQILFCIFFKRFKVCLGSWSFFVNLWRFIAKPTLFWSETFNSCWLWCFRSFDWRGLITIIAWTKLICNFQIFLIFWWDYFVLKVFFWMVFWLYNVIGSWTNCDRSLWPSYYIPFDFRIEYTFIITFNIINLRFFMWISMMNAFISNAYLIQFKLFKLLSHFLMVLFLFFCFFE